MVAPVSLLFSALSHEYRVNWMWQVQQATAQMHLEIHPYHYRLWDSDAKITHYHLIRSTSIEINNIWKCCALALLMSMIITPVHAFVIETKGGPKIKSEDGNFEIG